MVGYLVDVMEANRKDQITPMLHYMEMIVGCWKMVAPQQWWGCKIDTLLLNNNALDLGQIMCYTFTSNSSYLL
jgi:hypothetical protein